MPSWAIHLKIAKELAKGIPREEYQSFVLGNLLPDVNVGYLIHPVSKEIPYSVTHYGKIETFEGKTREFPNYQQFMRKYVKKIRKPIILGYLAHLATDFYWNYQTYIKKGIYENGKMIGLQGTNSTVFGEGEVLRQTKVKNFNSLSYHLYYNNLVEIPQFEENLIEEVQKVNEVHIEKVDLERVNQYFKEIPKRLHKEENSFQIFSLEEMEQNLKENVEFIQNLFLTSDNLIE